MKKQNLIPILVVCFLFISTKNYASYLRTGNANYKIEKADQLFVNKEMHDVWMIKFGTGENPVTIIKCNTDKGTQYIVRSDFFVVCYANSNKGFGARYPKEYWNNVPASINNAVINATQMKNQQIITPEKLDDNQALELIASYLPDLINENYAFVLN